MKRSCKRTYLVCDNVRLGQKVVLNDRMKMRADKNMRASLIHCYPISKARSKQSQAISLLSKKELTLCQSSFKEVIALVQNE